MGEHFLSYLTSYQDVRCGVPVMIEHLESINCHQTRVGWRRLEPVADHTLLYHLAIRTREGDVIVDASRSEIWEQIFGKNSTNLDFM